MSGGWGLSPWGLGPWGAGPAAFGTSQVYAISTNTIRVLTQTALLARSPVLPGDATNPATWRLIRTDTSEFVEIVSVTVVSSTEYILTTQLELPGQLVQLQLSAPGLLDYAGAIVPEDTVSFAGVTEEVTSTPEIIAAASTQGPRDLLNNPFPLQISGTLVIKGGDYANEFGEHLLRKLIIRRLVAKKGDFYHLPNYGVGLRAKSPIPAGNLVQLQTEIKQQIELEPDVASVSVALVQSTNTLFVTLTVVTVKTGQQLEIGIPISLGGGQ